MRIVLDTDVVVRAFRSPQSASAALVRAVRAGRATLVASLANALEYEDVLGRPEIVAGTSWKLRSMDAPTPSSPSTGATSRAPPNSV